MKLSLRAKNLKPSATLALAARAKELVTQGRDVISLSVGEPDWPTLPAAVKAGIAAIEAGQTKYGPSAGMPEFRKFLAEQSSRELGVNYKASEVTITAGAKFVVFSALQCLLDAGDEVLIPAPYWVSYPTMVELADAVPVFIPSSSATKFKISARDLETSITERTRLFIFNSPSNPTGEVYSREEIRELVTVLKKHPKVTILSDDIYSKLIFTGEETAAHVLQVAPELQNQTVVVNGASKTLSMTGWRVGWGLGPENVISAMTDYQSQSVSCTSTFAQMAALAGFKDSQSDFKNSLIQLRERRDLAIQMLGEIPQVSVGEPQGAFYLWISIQKLLGRKYNGRLLPGSGQFCKILLEEFNVAAVPGVEFGVEGHMRISYVLKKERMLESFRRLREFVSRIE